MPPILKHYINFMLFNITIKNLTKYSHALGASLLFILILNFNAHANAIPSEPLCMPDNVPLENLTYTLKIYENMVTFIDPDKKWCNAYRMQNGTHFITEFLPKGQDLNNWQIMLTLTAYNNVLIPFEKFKDTVSYLSPCKTSRTFTHNENKEFIYVCGKVKFENKEISEVTYYKFINTQNNTYIFFLSKRGKPFDAHKYEMSDEDVKSMEFLENIKLSKVD